VSAKLRTLTIFFCFHCSGPSNFLSPLTISSTFQLVLCSVQDMFIILVHTYIVDAFFTLGLILTNRLSMNTFTTSFFTDRLISSSVKRYFAIANLQ